MVVGLWILILLYRELCGVLSAQSTLHDILEPTVTVAMPMAFLVSQLTPCKASKLSGLSESFLF